MSRRFQQSTIFVVLACAAAICWSARANASQLLVSDIFNDRVSLYDLGESSVTLVERNFITSGSPLLDEPTNVEVGPDGRIYVASRGTGKVLVYNRNGQPSLGPGGLGVYADLGAGAAPAFMAFSQDGKLYVTDQGGDSVKVFDGISVNPIGSIVGPNVGVGSPDDDITLVQPSGVGFGADGNLYISTFDAFGASQLFVWDGATTSQIMDQATAANVGLFAAAGLEVVGNKIFVASLGGNGIVSATTAGVPTPPFYIPIPFDVPVNASFFPTNAPSDVISDGKDLLLSVLGSTNPGEAGTAGYPRGGLLRYKPDGTLVILAENLFPLNPSADLFFPASSLAVLEAEAVPEPSSIGLGMAGAAMLGCAWYVNRRRRK